MTGFPIVAVDASTAEELSLPAFIVARDGLYLRKRSLLGLSQVRVDGAHHLPATSESLEYGLPKLPARLVGQVLGFFGAIWRTKQSEALVLLSWDGSGFGLIVPEQRVAAASVEHRLDPTDVPSGVQLVGSIHSHGGMSAFASLTDEEDEADADGIHIVVGDLGRRRPSYSAAIVVDGRRFGAEPSLLLERPRRRIDPPAAWLDRVKLLPRTPKPRAKPMRSASARRSRAARDLVAAFDAPTLDALLNEASDVAAALGQQLTCELAPLPTPAAKAAAS